MSSRYIAKGENRFSDEIGLIGKEILPKSHQSADGNACDTSGSAHKQDDPEGNCHIQGR